MRPVCEPGTAVRTARDTPGRAGIAGLIAAFHLWTTITVSVDDATAKGFFHTHPVDGISAGTEGSTGRSSCLVLKGIPSPRTGRAACLHRLSTALCTERLDVAGGPEKTVGTVR